MTEQPHGGMKRPVHGGRDGLRTGGIGWSAIFCNKTLFLYKNIILAQNIVNNTNNIEYQYY
jgi:hypothetical protein